MNYIDLFTDDDFIDDDSLEISGEYINVSREKFKFDTKDCAIDHIISDFENRKITIPTFQRPYIWKADQAAQLIDSIYRGFPIPVIFIYSSPRGSRIVIDGQQRILSLLYLRRNIFPRHQKRKILHKKSLAGQKIDFTDRTFFSSFPLKRAFNSELAEMKREQLVDIIMNQSIRITDITPRTHDITVQEESEIIHQMFSRINTQSTPLSNQHVRAVFYTKHICTFLHRCNELNEWRALYGNCVENEMDKDIELIVRCLAMVFGRDCFPSNNTIKSHLDLFAVKLQKYTTDELNVFFKIFQHFLKCCGGLSHSDITRPLLPYLFYGLFRGCDTKLYTLSHVVNITSECIEGIRSLKEYRIFNGIQYKAKAVADFMSNYYKGHAHFQELAAIASVRDEEEQKDMIENTQIALLDKNLVNTQ